MYTTPGSTSVNTVMTIAFSNTVRAERSEDRHRMTPTSVLRDQYAIADSFGKAIYEDVSHLRCVSEGNAGEEGGDGDRWQSPHGQREAQ